MKYKYEFVGFVIQKCGGSCEYGKEIYMFRVLL